MQISTANFNAKKKQAFLFPAFTHGYLGSETNILNSFGNDFMEKLETASSFLKNDLNCFDIEHNNFLDDELKTQYLTYIISCSTANVLKQNGICPLVVSGVSMGLYAALHFAGAISFVQGLGIIHEAFKLTRQNNGNTIFGLASIIGLDATDLGLIIDKQQAKVEIVNKNGTHSFLVTGVLEDLERVISSCASEGALHILRFNASCPYHSTFMCGVKDSFTEYVNNIEISSPEIGTVSLVDQSILTTVDEVRKELVRNLTTHINWHKTMLSLVEREGMNEFFECGPGNSLYKIAKFIDGEFSIVPINKIMRFLEK